MMDASEARPIVLTIGHSTRAIETFTRLLQAHEVTQVADVRTVPRSRRNPQFNRETLPDTLSAVAIGYVHMAELGGLRRPRPDSPNNGWRDASFRAPWRSGRGRRHISGRRRGRARRIPCVTELAAGG